jgi:hypothetical protein
MTLHTDIQTYVYTYIRNDTISEFGYNDTGSRFGYLH